MSRSKRSEPGRRFERSPDQVWERFSAAINSANGRGRPARPTWRWLVAGALIGVTVGGAVAMAAHSTRRNRHGSGPTGRIEFVDVDGSDAPASLTR